MKVGSYWFCVSIIAAVVIPHGEAHSPGLNEIQKFSKASCNFTLNILKHLSNTGQQSNIVFSPVSISSVLSMLQQGAKGETLAQLEELLHLTTEETRQGFSKLIFLKEEPKVEFEWANRLYMRKGMKVWYNFLENVSRGFGVEIRGLDFENYTTEAIVTEMNRWVGQATHGKITDMIDPSMVSPATVMLLINAVYFKGNWLQSFEVSKSSKKLFKITKSRSVKIPFMNQRGNFYAGRDTSLGAQWLNLPFENQRFSMIFLLPTVEHRLNQLIEKLSDDRLKDILSYRGISEINVHIPKFKISQKISVPDTLRQLGLTDLFSRAPNLRGMTPENLLVSEMIHGAHIEVDERGSTSSAVTVVSFLRTQTSKLTFDANQPFLFFLVDTKKNIPLFAGKVVVPVP